MLKDPNVVRAQKICYAKKYMKSKIQKVWKMISIGLLTGPNIISGILEYAFQVWKQAGHV
jgi:hypothetical protein